MAEPLDDEPLDDQPSAAPAPAKPAKKRKKKKRTTALAPVVDPRREQRIRGFMMLAALSALVGIVLVGTGPSVVGSVLLGAGVLGLVAAIHFFGRLGPIGGES